MGLQRDVKTLNDQLFPMWNSMSYISKADGIWLGAKAGEVVFLPLHNDS